ncbi:MAG: PepSY domain-containing protein [Ruminiclostridium sp.]
MRSKLILIITIVVSILLVIGIIYYFQSGGKSLNESIPNDKLSAKELVEISKIYVDKYWGKRKYYIGKISMELDKNQQGRVEIWYKDDNKNKDGVPNIITVEIDTKSKKILKIIKQERNSKIVPGNINIEKWAIDSNNAINIAKDVFKKSNDFNYSFAYVSGTNEYKNGKEAWNISFYNESKKSSYYIKIDAYTGEIYSSEVK